MGVETVLEENGLDVTIAFSPPFKGYYSHDTPTAVPDGFLPSIVNCNLPMGIPEMMAGSALFAPNMVLSGTPIFFGVWYNSSGTPTYIGANTAGEVYVWNGSAWVYLRRGLSTSTTWWSATRISDVLVMTNKNDGIWKYDGTRLLPLGGKHIAGMESGETWSGGSADTTNVRQGTQAVKLTSTGAAVTASYTPSSALDLTNGIGPTARDYTTSDLIRFQIYLNTASIVDTTNTYIRLGNAGDTAYYQLAASGWGSLANGWNQVSVAKSAFAATGAPNWNNIAKITLSADSTGGTLEASFDDLYLRYAVVMPACQAVLEFKNALIGLNDTAGTSNVNYARVSAPDDYDVLATFPVAEGDGSSIVGGHVDFDQILIGKEMSMHSIYATISGTTYPAYRFAQTVLTTAYGLASHRSFVKAGDLLYWWSPRSVVVYDGSTVRKHSRLVDPTLAGLEFTRLPFIVGAFQSQTNQLWWSYTPAGGSTNTRQLRFDDLEQAWLPSTGQTLALLETVTSAGQELLLSVTQAGRVLQQGTGTTFDGSPIDTSLDLPWVSGPDKRRKKRWHECYVPLANGTGGVSLYYRTADHPREMAASVFTFAGTVSLSDTDEQGRVFIGARSRWIQLQIVNIGSGTSAPFGKRSLGLSKLGDAGTGADFQLLSSLELYAVMLPQRY